MEKVAMAYTVGRCHSHLSDITFAHAFFERTSFASGGGRFVQWVQCCKTFYGMHQYIQLFHQGSSVGYFHLTITLSILALSNASRAVSNYCLYCQALFDNGLQIPQDGKSCREEWYVCIWDCGNEDPHRPTLHECLSRFDIVVAKSMSKDSCNCANCL